MRVGFFTYGMNERMTGIARYAVQLTYALKRLEPALEIILLNPYPSSVHPWYKAFETYPLSHLRLLPSAASLGNLLLHQAARKLELDILHDPCGIAPFLFPTKAYKRVTTIHDAIPFIYPKTQPLLTRGVYHTLLRASRLTADGIFTVSASAARDLRQHLDIPQDKLFVTPLGIQLPEKVISPEARQRLLQRLNITSPYFLYVGALHPRKNIGRTLEAFLSLKKRVQNLQLVIVGPPSWGADEVLRQVTANAGSDKGIVFTGFVSDDDLHALYQAAKALVFPTLYEGFGLPALEAMAHGTPVITSNTSSLPEVVGEAGVLVDPLSTKAIEEAMQRLLDDETFCNTLATRGLERAKLFSWESTAQKTLAAYQHVLAAP
jgi:glycosyltransferase involved in cell wall biosynthesis